jgi:hypothetical protein
LHGLRVGIADGVVYADDALFVHMGNSIAAATTNADDFDDARLIFWQIKKHDIFLFSVIE